VGKTLVGQEVWKKYRARPRSFCSSVRLGLLVW
jgi:hypothetical protein